MDTPSLALGANVLGSVFGGLLENVSLITGMRALLLMTIIVYAFAGLPLLIERRNILRATSRL